MAIDYPTLRPFPSFLLLRLREQVPNQIIVGEFLSGAMHWIQNDEEGPTVLTVGEIQSEDDITYGAVMFEELVRPSWTIQDQPLDHVHDLLICIQRGRFLAVYFSDRSWRDGLHKLARDHSKGIFKKLEPIDPGILNAAFATGAARTLWLTGIHARSKIKSDSKVVAGMDLVSSLDALDDQSYHFTAARYKSNQLSFPTTIGFSPYESSFWVSQPMYWNDFLACADETLSLIESINQPNYSPIAVLAAPLTHAQTISDPFDVSLIAPELRAGIEDLPEVVRERLELWSLNSDIQVTPLGGPNARVSIYLAGQSQGQMDLTFDTSNPHDVVCHAEIIPGANNGPHLLEARTYFENRSWLTVHFGSGHTLLGRTLVSTRLRDVAFEEDQIVWHPFTCDITREKPTTLTAIGQQGSLFCWAWNEWPCPSLGNALGTRGWLACDDGANEVADFIHLDEDEPTITLIHVKASGSKETTRRISIGKFDIVVSQAVKNLRFLDQVTLADGLREGFQRQVGNLVLYNGQPTTRADMLDALEILSSEAKRRVVIVQPHLLKDRWEEAGQQPDSLDGRRMKLLNMVLVSADRSCRALNAQLHVVGCDG